MALIIKEFTVKVNMVQPGPSSPMAKNNEASTVSEKLRKDMIKECVEKVMEKLEAKTER